jgi:hypothetical protein
MADNQKVRELLVLFMQINPEPADEQVHALAHALGEDKETLESVIYEMFASTEEVQEADAASTHSEEDLDNSDQPGDLLIDSDEVDADAMAPGDVGLSEDQQVLDGDFEPEDVSPDALLNVDGAPAGSGAQQEIKDALVIAGLGDEGTTGMGADGAKLALEDDGAAPMRINATARLQMTAANGTEAPSKKPGKDSKGRRFITGKGWCRFVNGKGWVPEKG